MNKIDEITIFQDNQIVDAIILDENNSANLGLEFVLPTKKIIGSKVLIIMLSVSQDAMLPLFDQDFETDEFNNKDYVGLNIQLNNTGFLGNGLYNIVVCLVPLAVFDEPRGIAYKEIIDSYAEITRIVKANNDGIKISN